MNRGWREGKLDGGCVIEVESGEIVAGGLCLPHSPRWHDGKLWFLESGEATLCVLDPDSGAKEVVAQLAGFTRGLAFAGNGGFVGLSQLRTGPADRGLPVAERFDKHHSGIWAIDLRTGVERPYLRFGGEIDEVFEAAALVGLRSPRARRAGERAGAALDLDPRAAALNGRIPPAPRTLPATRRRASL